MLLSFPLLDELMTLCALLQVTRPCLWLAGRQQLQPFSCRLVPSAIVVKQLNHCHCLPGICRSPLAILLAQGDSMISKRGTKVSINQA